MCRRPTRSSASATRTSSSTRGTRNGCSAASRGRAPASPVPTWAYLGASCQTGDTSLTAVPGMKVVHYLNQFFAGLGAEEAAGQSPSGSRARPARAGARGLGLEIGDARVRRRPLRRARGGALAQLCVARRGAARRPRLRALVRLRALRLRVRDARARGRTSAVTRSVCGDGPREPRGDRGRRRGVHRPDEPERRRDARGAPVMAALAARLAAGEELGTPEDEGYLPRGLRRNERPSRTGAERAIDLLLAKLARRDADRGRGGFDSRAAACTGRRRHAGEARARHRGRLRAAGKPGRAADDPRGAWLRYPIAGERTLRRGAYESVHGGLRRHRRERAIRTGSCRSTPPGSSRGGADREAPRRFYTTTETARRSRPRRSSDRRSPRSCGSRRRGRHPLGHLRDGHALRGNAGEGDRAGGDPDRVRDRAADDRDDDRCEPRDSRRRDHESVRRSGAESGRRARAQAARSSSGRSSCSRPRSSPGTVWEVAA